MVNPLHTLVVDDEENIRFFLQEALQKSGYRVTLAVDGEQAFELLRENFFDLAIVDLHLGGKIDGLRVLEAIRWRWPETVVLILTGHGSLESAVSAIQEGVDGYLLKPVDADEIRKAINDAFNRFRRRSGASDRERAILKYLDIIIDVDRRQAKVGERLLELTPHEFSLLVYLVQNVNRVLTPAELIRAIHHYEAEDEKEAREIIKWYIHRLRKKIEPNPDRPRYLLNVRGVGYTLGDGKTARD